MQQHCRQFSRAGRSSVGMAQPPGTERYWLLHDSQLHLVWAATKGIDNPEQQVEFQYTSAEDRKKFDTEQSSALPTTARRSLCRVSQPGPCFEKFVRLSPGASIWLTIVLIYSLMCLRTCSAAEAPSCTVDC